MITARITSNLPQFLAGLKRSEISIYSRAATMVRSLTIYANKKMKLYTPRTSRSTGNLKSNIAISLKYGTPDITGISYVRTRVKYAYAIERGNQKTGTIRGNPKMSFQAGNWKKSGGARISKLAINGMYVFTKVKRGKYKGRHFTAKAFRDLKKYYNNKSRKYANELTRAIANNINIAGNL